VPAFTDRGPEHLLPRAVVHARSGTNSSPVEAIADGRMADRIPTARGSCRANRATIKAVASRRVFRSTCGRCEAPRLAGRAQFLDSTSPTMSVAATGDPLTKPKNGPKSRVAEKPVM
jgi:hypothetical protein